MKLFKKIIGYFLLLNLIPGLFILVQFTNSENSWIVYYIWGWLVNITGILCLLFLTVVKWLIED
jgi:hypothetical protein